MTARELFGNDFGGAQPIVMSNTSTIPELNQSGAPAQTAEDIAAEIGFDFEAARAKGATDEQINDYLMSQAQ